MQNGSDSNRRREEVAPRCPRVSFLQEELKDGRGVERNISSSWTGMRLGIGVMVVNLVVFLDRIGGSGGRIYLGAIYNYASFTRSIHYCDYPSICPKPISSRSRYKVNHGSAKVTWLNLSTTGETNPGVTQNTMFTQDPQTSNMTSSYLI